MFLFPNAGLGAQIDVLEAVVAEKKYGELSQLRKDLGATHTRVSDPITIIDSSLYKSLLLTILYAILPMDTTSTCLNSCFS